MTDGRPGAVSAGAEAAGMMLSAIGFERICGDCLAGDSAGTLRSLVMELTCGRSLDWDAARRMSDLECVCLDGICLRMYRSAASLLGWEGPLMRMNVTVHVTAVGEDATHERRCRTMWLSDTRGTPAVIRRRDCLEPDDAMFLAGTIGRTLKDGKAHGPGSPAGLGKRSRRPAVDEWLLGEDSLDQFLSLLCMQQILYRALCYSLGNTEGVRRTDIVEAALGQEASADPVTGSLTFTGIEGEMLLESVGRLTRTGAVQERLQTSHT